MTFGGKAGTALATAAAALAGAIAGSAFDFWSRGPGDGHRVQKPAATVAVDGVTSSTVLTLLGLPPLPVEGAEGGDAAVILQGVGAGRMTALASSDWKFHLK